MKFSLKKNIFYHSLLDIFNCYYFSIASINSQCSK